MYRRRIIKRRAKKSQASLIITIIFLALFLYASINWIIPNFIGGLGLITNFFNPPQPRQENIVESAILAPPDLLIPYEATNTSSIDIEGFAAPNSQVELYLDDQLEDTVDVSSDGRFTFRNISLKLGTNNVYGQAVDDKGQKSLPSKNQKIIYDNEKPALEIFEPEDGKEIKGERKLNLSGQTEVGAFVFINDSQIIVDHEGKFKNLVNLNDGENIFNIKAQDKAGNITEVTRRVVFTP